MSVSATALRRTIHTYPDLSGNEKATADRLRDFFSAIGLNECIEDLGGPGLAVIIAGRKPGPTIMLRAELDALPISEPNRFDHRSIIQGVAHKCGHDGHMAILAEVGQRLAAKPPETGRVVLLFQPAEETGQGALDVLADPRFESIKPDQVYALHNLPGTPFGHVLTRPGTFSCASSGMHIHLSGLETHAAQPEQGISPSRALCELVQMIESPAEQSKTNSPLDFATVTHLSMGSKSFGIAPGAAHIMVTFRSEHDAIMSAMIDQVTDRVSEICSRDRLEHSIEFDDKFPATTNEPAAFERIRAAVPAGRLTIADKPFRWSEDFGHFTSRFSGAMFGLGAGRNTAALHHPEYDFPDDLIDQGADIFMRLVRPTAKI